MPNYEDESHSLQNRMRELADQIRTSIHKNQVHFQAAGEHIDAAFNEDAVRSRWSEREDVDLEVLDRVSMCFARFNLAVGHYLSKTLPFQDLRPRERLLAARTVLLLTWIITDPDADRMQPALSDLQNWPWGIDAEGQFDPLSRDDLDDSYHRYLAKVSLIGFKGEAWYELALEAWRVHELDLQEHEGLLKSSPASGSTNSRGLKKQSKYSRLIKPLEKLIRDNGDRPMGFQVVRRALPLDGKQVDPKTIKDAIAASRYLKNVYKDFPQKGSAREQQIGDKVLDTTPQAREVNPVDAAISNEDTEREQKIQRLVAEENKEEQRADRQAKKARRRS